MGERHANAKHDDAAWRGWFARWHAGERAAALRAEADVCPDTWAANARRLGMRLMDLPEDHPARRRRAPPFAERPDDWKPARGVLCEGQWRTLFAFSALGVPDVVLAAWFGVKPPTISGQAKQRGLARRGWRGRTPAAALATALAAAAETAVGREETVGAAAGVAIDPGDGAGTLARFDAAVAAAGAAADFAGVEELCRARAAVARALFQGGRGAGGRGAAPTPPALRADVPPRGGEGEADAVTLGAGQRPPKDPWGTWLFLGGRGAGKTFAGAAWLAEQAEAGGAGTRWALVGPSLHDVREVMIGGPSGLMSLPRWRAAGAWPVYEPSRRRLSFPGGAVAWAYSSEDPEGLRGPQHHGAWADELCAWPRPAETLALLRMGLRLGADPRLVVTTTPKPIAALRGLMAEPGVKLTRAATRDNAARLAPGFLARLEAVYGGTRWAAQELEGLVTEAAGAALWTAAGLAACRGEAPGRAGLERVVVAVDPPAGEGGSACGLVVAGRAAGRGYVLEDLSVAGLSPLGWARRAAAAARAWDADIVAEANQGGAMVRAVLAAAGARTRVRLVHAGRGKAARAEPVAALYEQGRVTHAPGLAALEEALMAFGAGDPAFDGAAREGPEGAGDRVDALVWAPSELLLGPGGEGPRMRRLDWRS